MVKEPKIYDYSPLRYPGSKKSLIKYLYNTIKHNMLKPDIFVEPFVGGCSVTLHFLINKIVKRAIISDKDILVSSFWEVLISNPLYLIEFIQKVDITLNNFYLYKGIAKSARHHNKFRLAEACVFLNRTSFSGLLTNRAGPIGGKSQKGKYKVDCRFNRRNLIDRIIAISEISDKIIVIPGDWKKTVNYAIERFGKMSIGEEMLFYFDPPFYNKADDLYRQYFKSDEHQELFRKLRNLRFNWILSYDNAKEIIDLYSKSNYENINIDMPYSINSHAQRRERELIISPLRLPQFESENKRTYSLN